VAQRGARPENESAKPAASILACYLPHLSAIRISPAVTICGVCVYALSRRDGGGVAAHGGADVDADVDGGI